ncbi:MAG: hypothetical protein R3220_04630 [Balneolaceae bacterium]|nr:hypothetical protein [Balneolaceae bacterium]
MNPNNSDYFQTFWLKCSEFWHRLDQILEAIVQQTIDDVEKTYQKD